MPTPRVLLLPGPGNSEEEHWHTLRERAYPEFLGVGQDEYATLRRLGIAARLGLWPEGLGLLARICWRAGRCR